MASGRRHRRRRRARRHPEDRGELESLLAWSSYDAGDSTFLDSRPPSPTRRCRGWVARIDSRPGPFTPGQRVGNYRILRRLKPGGMGMLYVAEDNLHREVVIKVLAPRVRGGSRLRREAEAMARAQASRTSPPSTPSRKPTAFRSSCRNSCAGRDLRERLEQEGPYDPPAVIDLGLAVAEALRAAHTAGVIHRDLKPENIMLSGQTAWREAGRFRHRARCSSTGGAPTRR